MDFSNKQFIICYVDADKIIFYQPPSGALFQLDIPSDIISHLDLLHKEKFETLLESFMDQSQIVGDVAAIIYSATAVFEKSFPQVETRKDDEETQKFIEMVPFDEVLSKVYRANKNIRVVALNDKIHDSIRNVFNKRSIGIFALAPASILQENFIELKDNIDLGFISKHVDSIKQYSMISTNAVVRNQPVEKKQEVSNSRKRIFILGGVFAVLLIVLIFMILSSLSSDNSLSAPPRTKAIPKRLQNTPTPQNIPAPVTENTLIDTQSSPSGEILTPNQ